MGGRTPPAWRRTGSRPSLGAALCVAAALILIAVLTLTPTPGAAGSAGFCVFCGSLGGVDFALNVLLFAPLGAAIWNATGSWRRAMIVGVVVSLFVEALQYRVIVGRDATAGDVLANALGTLVGSWIAIGGVRIASSSAATLNRVAAVVGFATAAVAVASGVLLLPRPTALPQWVLWAPVKLNEEPFRGNLESVAFAGRALNRGDVLRPYQTLDSTTRSQAVTAIVSGPIPTAQRPAIIVRMANPLEEGFQLSQRGNGVAFRAYSFAARLRLRTLQIGMGDVLLAATDSENGVTVEAISAPDRMTLSARRLGASITSVTLPRTVGLAWTMFLPWNAAIGPHWWPANLCFLAGLMLPVAFLTTHARRVSGIGASSVISWWPVALVVATLALLVPVTGLGQLRLSEWMGVGAGIVVGVLLARLMPLARGAAGDTTS